MVLPLNVDYLLRRENSIDLTGSKMVFFSDLNHTLAMAGIVVANAVPFDHFYHLHWMDHVGRAGPQLLGVGTVIRTMTDKWRAVFQHIPLRIVLRAIARQGEGQEGQLLTNGTVNGVRINDDWAITFRWHDPARPFPIQTAQFGKIGWSFMVVHAESNAWCPQGSRILFPDDQFRG